MNKENCALKLVDEIILYYDARSKKHQITYPVCCIAIVCIWPVLLVAQSMQSLDRTGSNPGSRICLTFATQYILLCCPVPTGHTFP